MKENNKKLSNTFSEMAAIYRYLGGEERFRALAYQKAARIIEGLPRDIIYYNKNNRLEAIRGIGESIAKKIKEYITLGRISKYEELKRKVPNGIMELLNIRGFGPQTIRKIYTNLRIDTKDELIKALQDGRVEKLEGFGKKKVENMLNGLKLHKIVEDRMLLWDALKKGENVLAWLKLLPEVIQVELAGSLRRKKETIGDIDVLLSCKEIYRKKIIKHFTNPDFSKEVINRGETKASIILKDSKQQVDLRIVNEEEWGAALQYFTGSKEHNIHLRTIAKERGYKISEYGIFYVHNDKRIAGRTEEEIYKTLGFQMIPPEMREDCGEIELSSRGKIPTLVSLNDLRGDMHIHSNWSDGTNSIEEIVRYIKKNFNYEYIVITDHSKSSRIAKGMDENQLLKQIELIKQLNEKLGENFIKTGIEVDILPNGKLDISNEILSQLDWVIASIHSNFNQDNTDRLISACENNFVCCVGHPTGRLIGSRDPYKIDIDKLIEAASITNTVLEINAQPQRMDLCDEFARMASQRNVKLVIGTDSHALEQFNYMQLGISIARRAWCKTEDIINTKPWNEIKKIMKN